MRGLSPAALGVVLALCAYAVYSTSDAMVKGLGGSLSPFEIGLFTTIFSIIPAIFSKPKADRWRDTFRFNRFWMVQLIGLTRTICAISITYSFVTIPLAEAYSIVFLTPVFATILSVLVLREEVTLDRWALVIVSFVGVLIVVRPGFRELELGHITAVICAVCAAISVIAMRMISGTERRITLFVMPGLYTLVTNLVLIIATGFSWPSWTLLGGLLVCGVLGGVGYLMQITALSKAPASRVAPTQYSQLVWALVFGAAFFNEVPDAVGLAGLGLVVASGVANVFADGARARIAGRWAEYRGRREINEPTGFQGPGPDPV
jgi:drug/metabolite transporter (DMT)-like permease